MEPIRRYAAIDIGSNAIRLLFSNVIYRKKDYHFHKDSLIRIPVRLGSDSFLRGEISPARSQEFVQTMQAFALLIKVYQVEDYMACATSALREAKNGAEVVKEASEKSGLNIQLIDGSLEAKLIYSNHVAEGLGKSPYLYIDIGGGSTELTLFSKGEKQASRSFRIGTIRVLEKLVEDSEWKELESWLRTNLPEKKNVIAIGTGGNINKLFKLSGRKEGEPLFRQTLNYYERYLKSFSYEERIDVLHLRPDRADVIIPAIEICKRILKKAKIQKLIVPKVGLADGMVHLMHEKHLADLAANLSHKKTGGKLERLSSI